MKELILKILREHNNISEGEKKNKTKKDACYYKVKSRYKVWPSAYASGALVKCRKVGAKNWGNSTKEQENIERQNVILEKRKLTSKPSSESNLRDWFGRKGAKGSTGGWVDCNSPDGKGGYKSCGRQEGEKRSKYPACRPTPSACKKYKSTKGKSWGKKAAKESLEYHLINKIPITENVFRYGSKSFFDLINEARLLHQENKYIFSEPEVELLSSDLGKFGTYNGETVPLDMVLIEDNPRFIEFIPYYELIQQVREDWGTDSDLYHLILEAIFDGDLRRLERILKNYDVYDEYIGYLSLNESELIFEEDKFKGKKSGSPQRDSSGGKAYKVYVAGCSTKTKTNPRGIKLIRFGSGGLKAKLNDSDAKKRYNQRHGCSKGRHNDKCMAGYYSCRLPRYAKALGLSGGGTWW